MVDLDIKYRGAIYRFRDIDCKPESYYPLPKKDNMDDLQPVLQCINDSDTYHYATTIHSEHSWTAFGRWEPTRGDYVRDYDNVICTGCTLIKRTEEI